MNFITKFDKSRRGLIGSSDIPALLQHPETTESLAGYGRTAVTVWQEKCELIERQFAGFEAEVGRLVEPIVLRKFIIDHESRKTADDFFRGYLLCELDKRDDGYPTAPDTQNTSYLHHTEAVTDFGVAHADCVNGAENVIIEAKTASFWSSHRDTDIYKGYDESLTGRQGIPLGNYFQVVYQCALYQERYNIQIDRAFLALLYDMNRYHEWEIKVDRRVQERLLEIAHYLKICIDQRKPPKNLAMNKNDIQIMYPKLDEDFRHVSGDELETAVKAARQAKEAKRQIKAWKQKEEDATNTLAVILKNAKNLQGIVDGEINDLAMWVERGESERLIGLSEIEKDKRLYRYMKKNELIKKVEASRYVKVKLKE